MVVNIDHKQHLTALSLLHLIQYKTESIVSYFYILTCFPQIERLFNYLSVFSIILTPFTIKVFLSLPFRLY